jgi:hypothetical protein
VNSIVDNVMRDDVRLTFFFLADLGENFKKRLRELNERRHQAIAGVGFASRPAFTLSCHLEFSPPG